jgi:hypothetical protein
MKQRSSDNWKTKSGGWDALNTELIDFYLDYPVLSSILQVVDVQVVMCNNYKYITEQSLISTFVDDYILERFWNNPKKYIEYFKEAKYVMSPDYSLLLGMPKPMQMWNIYRNRLVGYIWQSAGINVIPTISWSDQSSFEYCFKGVEIGSVVAVSNIGCTNEDYKIFFDEGFNEMINIIKPEKILFQCNKKYKEHYKDERIIFIDSFWDNKRKQLKNK